MLEIGALVADKYRIQDKIGQGGMSVVYLATNEKTNKRCAVKEVRKDGMQDFQIVRQRLVVEADILKKLSHPNLPGIMDVIDTEDAFVIIMDYIQGSSLNKVLDAHGAQPQERVIAWAKQLCDVLRYLHSRTPAIIYRDMKPANIMLRPDGNVTLIDFGTAREFNEQSLGASACLGTVGYAAPEQFGGMGQTDARTDIYCLGATLYHLVTGIDPCQPPHEMKPIREIDPRLSGELERIILKCTRRDPNERYQSVEELMHDLERSMQNGRAFRKKQKRKLAAFLACVAMTLVFAATSAWGYFAAENQKKEDYVNLLVNVAAAEDFYEAIVIDPSRMEAYLGNGDCKGLVDFLIADGVLTGEESAVLDKLKNGLPHTDMWGRSSTVMALDELKAKNPDGYAQVCCQIGESYVFYYKAEADKDRYAAAVTWLRDAGEQSAIAQRFCEISACLENIHQYSGEDQQESLRGEYKTLWERIKLLQADASGCDDETKLRIWDEVVTMVQRNAGELCEASSQEEVVQLLNAVQSGSEQITDAGLQERVSFLQGSVEAAKAKVGSLGTEMAQ